MDSFLHNAPTMQKKFRAIFWDNDGILVDTEPLFVRSLEKLFPEFGLTGDAEALSRENAAKGHLVWKKFWAESGKPEVRDRFVSRLTEVYCDFLREGVPHIEGVEETLAALHKHYPMAIVTASLCEPFHLMHEQTGFLKYFDFWLTREDFENSKPHPDPYHAAFKRMKKQIPDLRPSECLVLEDAERGVVAAKEAGMTVWAIPTEFTRPLNFSRADKILKGIRELKRMLL